ncbi:glucose 1-dehydrogenase [Flavobacterium micromati]|uniref:Glucose 1-dehydrogenase n=1 Tax=Flavobacterium micromati TaxID=229205 RepID=A0A1M5N4J0_9FLAO|nr:SDR family oxidoreductase [Flavobacterium micromati]MCL6462809.1 SDR family oxidoreductase [Flavobacterium micromati]SHG84367.1 glucose 1-dehydrogenase [Flavobacterium micromati]
MTKDKTLAGKTVIITGADSGIGQAIADELSKKGASILINYFQDEAGAKKTLKLVTDNGSKGLIFQADISDYNQVKVMYEAACLKLGVPYILINNAGVDASGITLDKMDVEVFDLAIRTNLYGVFYNCKEFIRLRKKEKGNGKIVNITSVHEDLPRAGASEYCASKGAIRNITRCLSLELAEFNINVNNLAPGMVLTPMNQKAMDDPELLKKQVQSIPLKRAAEPWEIAKLAAYLVSDDAAYATGKTFTLDGGLTQNLGQGA